MSIGCRMPAARPELRAGRSDVSGRAEKPRTDVNQSRRRRFCRDSPFTGTHRVSRKLGSSVLTENRFDQYDPVSVAVSKMHHRTSRGFGSPTADSARGRSRWRLGEPWGRSMATPPDDGLDTIGLPLAAEQERSKDADPSKIAAPERASVVPHSPDGGQSVRGISPWNSAVLHSRSSDRDPARGPRPGAARRHQDPDPQEYATVSLPGRRPPDREDPSSRPASPVQDLPSNPPFGPESAKPEPELPGAPARGVPADPGRGTAIAGDRPVAGRSRR